MLREIAGDGLLQHWMQRTADRGMTLLSRDVPVVTALGRAVLQCYYRDDRVLRGLATRTGGAFSERASAGTG